MAVTFLFGVIGLIDDYLKLRYSNSKGLSGRSRLLWEILVALSASSLIYYFATSAEETTLFLPFSRALLYNGFGSFYSAPWFLLQLQML